VPSASLDPLKNWAGKGLSRRRSHIEQVRLV